MKTFILFLVLILLFYWTFSTNSLTEKFEDIDIDNSNYQHDHRIQLNKYNKASITHQFDTRFPLPTGSWQEKCELINWKHPYLWAKCYDDLRHPHNTSINIHECGDSPIHVHNGHLDCD